MAADVEDCLVPVPGTGVRKKFWKVGNLCAQSTPGMEVSKNRNSSMNIEEFLLTLKTTNMKILTIITSVKTLIWLPQGPKSF